MTENTQISRSKIGAKLRTLRSARRWTQGELAKQLRVSQPQLSQIERGVSSLTAEQFLQVLGLFNVGANEFVAKPADREAETQNAVARLGATDLQEREGIVPSAHLQHVNDVVREALVVGSPRLVTALAPVLVKNADDLQLKRLEVKLAEVGLERRLAWLVESTFDAVNRELPSTKSRDLAKLYRRALVVLDAYLDSANALRDRTSDDAGLDVLDREIRSKKTLEQVKASSSPFAKRWGIVTGLQTEDFAHALRASTQ